MRPAPPLADRVGHLWASSLSLLSYRPLLLPAATQKSPRSRLRCPNICHSASATVFAPASLSGEILVIPPNFIQLSQNWMKGAVSTSSPDRPLRGLGRKGETRAPTKLFWDCPVTDSECSRLIFAGNDRSHCELLIYVLHTHTKTAAMDFGKINRL